MTKQLNLQNKNHAVQSRMTSINGFHMILPMLKFSDKRVIFAELIAESNETFSIKEKKKERRRNLCFDFVQSP